MDAWETLYDNSTLGDGHDAWQHLLAQGAGDIVSGVGPSTADSDYSNIEADVGMALSSSVDDIILEMDLEEALSANADDEILTTEVCP